MVSRDEVKYALKNIWQRKTRSALTILSILIGVMAIAALTSFGVGLKSYVNNLSESSGVDKLFIQAKGIGAPGTDNTFSLSSDDVDFVSKVNGVKNTLGIYMKVVEIKKDDQKKYNYIMGYPADQSKFIEESFGVDMFSGRRLKNGELGKVVLGFGYTKDNSVFKRKVSVGDRIEINGNVVEVVGFLKEIGNPQDDANIMMTKEYFENFFPEDKDKYGFVIASSEADIDPNTLADKIREKLRKHLGQDKGKETFYVQTFADAIKTFSTILDVITGILILIALISVIVASVNIMNTMYTAVLERTKEIGVMKAVGAQNKDIFFVFVFESGVLGLFGGTIGMLVGYLLASIGGAIAKAAGYALLQPGFPISLTIGCMVFSFLIGVISGFFPALQAAKQKPVDSLRYE
ncbi:MAG: ABC transporter permease [Candidatus Woesearchaeota archaeon]|jgi:putative ABC transport system permease protein